MRMDGYALRRAKALLRKVGIIRLHELLDELSPASLPSNQRPKKMQKSTFHLELPNSGSGNHGSETGVRLCDCSTSVPSGCGENGGRHDCRNGA